VTLLWRASFFCDDKVESFEVVLFDFFSLRPFEVLGLMLGSGFDPLCLLKLHFALVNKIDGANVKNL
jgi:hypothetical protein